MPAPSPADGLLEQVCALRERGLHLEQELASILEAIHPAHAASARNFLHYLALRRLDIRPLQMELAMLGLSSFGVLESHVLASLNAVAMRLAEMGMHPPPSPTPEPPVDFISGPRRLRENARNLLGEARDGREVSIMVTLPSEAASEEELIPSLIEAGMEIARINCAHDGPETWLAMIQKVRAAALAQGHDCRIQADLAGPKSRTGRIRPLGYVLKLRPERDFRGRVVREALLWITPKASPAPAPNTPTLLFQGEGLGRLLAEDTLELTDARGRLRLARVLQAGPEGALLAFERTAYIEEGCAISTPGGRGQPVQGQLFGAPPVFEEIRLKVGDPLILTRADLPGCAGVRDPQSGEMIEPARVHCTLEAAFEQARPEQRVWLDDGRIGGVIVANDGQLMRIAITHAAPQGSRLKEEKGINFPDTEFDVPALTAKDLEDLQTLAGQVDLIALSFLRKPSDVSMLQQQLEGLEASKPGIVLKIENRQAFENLPGILLAAMRSARAGVMVARGDLAVEMGFERLSEVQEEILWLCEAAHIPVIWATQILESLAKSGAPSRPEVTDAAMSIRAECAMLNKGPHIIEAVRFLVGVLSRMEGHYSKRMALRRKLSIAERLPRKL